MMIGEVFLPNIPQTIEWCSINTVVSMEVIVTILSKLFFNLLLDSWDL